MSDPEIVIPSLPFDIALDCLLRIPLHLHPHLAQVCQSWRSAVSNPCFLSHRHSLGYTDHYACFIQAVPAPSPAGKSPVYGITVYDSKHRSWRRLPPIPDFAAGSLPLFCQCAAVGCKLVLLGGLDPSSYAVLRTVYVFDFSSGRWRKGSSMPSTRSFFSCAALGGRVAVAGGHGDDKTALRTAEMYNVEEDAWEALPDMNEARDECKAVVLDGKLVVVSGFPTEAQGQFCRSAEAYEEEQKAWTLIEGMWPAGLAPISLAAMGGHLFACFQNHLMTYKEKSVQWEALAELPRTLRASACVTPLGDALLVTGYSGGALEAFECAAGIRPYAWRKVDAATGFTGVVHGVCAMQL